MPTLRRRGNGAWFIDYRIGARRLRRSCKTRNPAVAKKKLRELEAELALGLHQAPSTTRLSAFSESFLAHQTGRRDDKTVAGQRMHLARFLEHAGDTMLSEIRPLHVTTFLESVTTVPGTWNRYRTSLHRMFQHAIQLGEVVANPVARVPRQREERKPPRFLTTEERERVLAAVKDQPLEIAVALGAFAGLRRAEICRLEWGDVDLERGQLIVRKAKSKRFRAVPIARRLSEILARAPRGESPFVALRDGKPWTINIMSKEVADLGHRLGLSAKLRGPHALRETFASLLAEVGENLYQIKDWLGHSSIAVTERYAHLLPGRRGKIDEV